MAKRKTKPPIISTADDRVITTRELLERIPLAFRIGELTALVRSR